MLMGAGFFFKKVPTKACLLYSEDQKKDSLGRQNGEGDGTHPSTLAWKTPWTEEPGALQAMGSLRVGHD